MPALLISAVRSSTGAAAETVRLALRGELTTLMDYNLACEYRDVALRAEQLHLSGKSRAETAAILDALGAIAERAYLALQHRPSSQDPNDDKVWMLQSPARQALMMPLSQPGFPAN